MQPTQNCLNCGAHLSDSDRFCSHCGQLAQVHRLSLAHLLHEGVHFFTHADKGIFYLVKMLATKPGVVVREYVQGRRKRYFSPLNFFFIVIGLFLFVQTTFKPMQMISMDKARQEVRAHPDPTVRERRLAKLDRLERGNNFMAKYSNYINMAVTPLMALVFFLAFYKSGYNYTEHLVGHLYFAGFSALFYIFVITPWLVLSKGKPVYYAGIALFLVWEAVYRAIGYFQFTQRKGIAGFLYCLAVSLLAIIGWAVLSSGLFSRYVETGFR